KRTRAAWSSRPSPGPRPRPAPPPSGLAERTEEGADVGGERFGFLEGREVAASRHDGPALDVVGALGPRARRQEDLARERGVGGRDGDALALGQRPRAVKARVVRPERRIDRAGDPVERHVGQERVLAEAPLHVAAAVTPRPELLDDPRGEPDRRIGEPEGERLWLRALDPLVARLLAQPGL